MAFKTTIMMQSKERYMANVPAGELITAMKDLSNGAYQLLMYHYAKNNGWVFVDSEIADALNTSERMIKQYRKELIEKKYLLIMKGTVDVYFIGRQAVMDFEAPKED